MFGFRRRGDAKAAAEIARFWDFARNNNLEVLRVEHVYQTGRRGTKAMTSLVRTGERVDTWFWWDRVVPDRLVAVDVGVGWGSHTHRQNVHYVGREFGGTGIASTARGDQWRRAQRHHRRASDQAQR